MASLSVDRLFELINPSPPTIEEHFQNWQRLVEVLKILGDASIVRRCTASGTWVDGSPATVAATDDDSGAVLSVLLPRMAGKDPNVRSGDSFFYRSYDGGFYPSSDGYLDDKKLTQKNWAGLLANIPAGWAVCDGVANSVGNGGSGLNLSNKFLKWSTSTAGTFGSSNTGLGGAHSGDTAVSTTGITINDASLSTNASATGITIDGTALTTQSATTGITIDKGGSIETSLAGTGITINLANVTVNSAYTGISVDSYDLEYTGSETTGITLTGGSVTIANNTTGINLNQVSPATVNPKVDVGTQSSLILSDPGHNHIATYNKPTVSDPGHKHEIDPHAHDITDPGHYHTTVDHSHTINDPQHLHTIPDHTHGVTDPGHVHSILAHSHGVTDPTHSHTIPDHGHTITDPGHDHSFSVPDHVHTAGEPPFVTLIPIERIH